MIPVIPSDSASIYEGLTELQYKDSRLAILRPSNPPPGIAGYLMDIVDDDSVELESDITDHYIEDNTAVQDQIALKPETITVRGQVAELVKYEQPLVNTAGNTLNSRLPLITPLQPQLTDYWAERQQTTTQDFLVTQQNYASTNSLYGFYDQKYPRDRAAQSQQSRIFGYFYQLWKGRQYFSVETPWGFFNFMAIQSLAFNQGPATRYTSEITITFKKLRFAQSIDLLDGQNTGRAVDQKSAITQNANVAVRELSIVERGALLAEIGPPISP